MFCIVFIFNSEIGTSLISGTILNSSSVVIRNESVSQKIKHNNASRPLICISNALPLTKRHIVQMHRGLILATSYALPFI